MAIDFNKIKEEKDIKKLEIFSKKTNNKIREAVASNLNCTYDIYKRLSNDKCLAVLCALAKNPNCPIDILEDLSKNKHFCILASIIENINCTVEILDRLSIYYKDFEIMRMVGRHSKILEIIKEISKETNSKILEDYARKYKCLEINVEILKNPYCTDDVLRIMAKNENIYVIEKILNLPNIPKDIIEDLKRHEEPIIRAKIAIHSKTPVRILKEFTKDTSKYVLSHLARNINSTPDILRELASKKRQSINILYEVYHNPNCPIDVKEKLNKIDGEKGYIIRTKK